MTRSEEIENAARALIESEKVLIKGLAEGDIRSVDTTNLDVLRAALALPPDPPGECCRRAAEAMREACAVAADNATAADLVLSGDYYRRLPLPGAKEGA